MTPIRPHNYIQSYEAGIEALKARPHDRDLQHQVVLALARAGALDFAMSEYNRYGLAEVDDHEDIMALNGRLSKDLYLCSSGPKAAGHARDAAQKYEVAFQKTLGYYSGINSATMALMADMPAERISARIEAIQALLKSNREVTPTDRYFLEATRAEVFLLKGERSKAIAALHGAIDYDPLNYAAHSSTLKQFMMIVSKRGGSIDWLSDFRPPRPLHFAGHIRLDQNVEEQEALKTSIVDALQQEDVGFGFGALAAGGDILFAEALLEQGAELHIVLPCAKDAFMRESVTPFGQDWGDRFEDCLAHASSIRILTQGVTWPDTNLNRLSGLSAMGHAKLQGGLLSAAPLQMLILNDAKGVTLTATHAQDWAVTGYPQFKLIGGTYRTLNLPAGSKPSDLPCWIKYSNQEKAMRCPSVVSAVMTAMKRRERVQAALHIELGTENVEFVLDQILSAGAPHSLLASEAFASVFAAMVNDQFKINYAGQAGNDPVNPVRCYSIQTARALLNVLP